LWLFVIATKEQLVAGFALFRPSQDNQFVIVIIEISEQFNSTTTLQIRVGENPKYTVNVWF
jgi:hypothetical protein